MAEIISVAIYHNICKFSEKMKQLEERINGGCSRLSCPLSKLVIMPVSGSNQIHLLLISAPASPATSPTTSAPTAPATSPTASPATILPRCPPFLRRPQPLPITFLVIPFEQLHGHRIPLYVSLSSIDRSLGAICVSKPHVRPVVVNFHVANGAEIPEGVLEPPKVRRLGHAVCHNHQAGSELGPLGLGHVSIPPSSSTHVITLALHATLPLPLPRVNEHCVNALLVGEAVLRIVLPYRNEALSVRKVLVHTILDGSEAVPALLISLEVIAEEGVHEVGR
mmetsp:Transcript_31463/g.94131  ORF Transcript_31463/g.94131 Transcript_31463/m.94131 type:complete len:280 (+) Transcript_31463:170-1009(+)